MNSSPRLIPTVSEVHLTPTAGRDGRMPSLKSANSDSGSQLLDVDEEIVNIENVTVKFRIEENQIIAQVYPNCMTLAEVKTDIARRFELPPELLKLSQEKCEPNDECRIRETDCNEFGIYEYDLALKVQRKKKDSEGSESDEPKLDLDVYYNNHRLPDFIRVYIPPEGSRNGKAKNLVVEIQNRAIIKPFLCGYVDKNTGIEYLDAFTQTGPFVNKCKFQTYACRDTQTFEHKVKHIDTMHDQTSQCWLDGNNVRFYSEATDYQITAGPYISYAQIEREKNLIGKIRLIQKNFRRWKWMKWMRVCAKEYRRLVANREAEEKAFEEEQVRCIRREERAKLFPRTADDFDLLYGEVQKWKMAELKRISQMFQGAARVAEVNLLLDKEIKLLSGIERQQQLLQAAMEDFREEQLLKKLGEPIKWVGYGDTTIHLDLIRTQRARFLTEVYKDLQKPLPKDERMKLLTRVREILLNERDFPHFGELFDMFDRERNLLFYAKNCDVEILRKRSNLLFVELIKFKGQTKTHKLGNRMCMVCKKVKRLTQFALRTRQNHVDTCKKCFYLKEASTENVVFSAILRAIQREERKKRCSNSFAFIMQVDDIRHMIIQIWHGHSILNKCDNLSTLRLPRWIKSEEWAPWNCICLTDVEARNHYRVENLEKVYDHKTRLEVGNRHLLARNVFHNLTNVAVEFKETGQWWNVGLNRQRIVRLDEITDTKGLENTKKKETKIEEINYTCGKML